MKVVGDGIAAFSLLGEVKAGDVRSLQHYPNLVKCRNAYNALLMAEKCPKVTF
jgi:hypothetical protein